jgi:glycolate oxidase iron-sulfur subunit
MPDLHPRQPDSLSPQDQALYADTLHCNRCGFCTSSCPTYIETGNEAFSPRGRNQAFRALLEGRLENPADAKAVFSSCHQCGICTSVCFSQVPTASLMAAAKEKILELEGV